MFMSVHTHRQTKLSCVHVCMGGPFKHMSKAVHEPSGTVHAFHGQRAVGGEWSGLRLG